MNRAIILSALLLTTSTFTAFAAGSSSSTPPKKTQTSSECTGGQIFDAKTETCVDADKQSFNDDQRYNAVRELAYAGAYDRAEMVIASADQPDDARFLNYRGFIQRKQGNMEAAMGFYTAALTKDPDLLLARSYMGQGLVADGNIDGAKAQLVEIASRGGRDTWAYEALKTAINGQHSDY